MKIENKKGLSLIEILIIIIIFSVLGVLTTNAIFLTLRSANKGNSSIKIRDNVNYFLSIIQRQLRGAQDIVNCPNSQDTGYIEYIDDNGTTNRFTCNLSGDLGYIASGSARLNTEEIDITTCSFTCIESESGNPPSVTVNITAEDATTSIPEIRGNFTTTTKIYLRNN